MAEQSSVSAQGHSPFPTQAKRKPRPSPTPVPPAPPPTPAPSPSPPPSPPPTNAPTASTNWRENDADDNQGKVVPARSTFADGQIVEPSEQESKGEDMVKFHAEELFDPNELLHETPTPALPGQLEDDGLEYLKPTVYTPPKSRASPKKSNLGTTTSTARKNPQTIQDPQANKKENSQSRQIKKYASSPVLQTEKRAIERGEKKLRREAGVHVKEGGDLAIIEPAAPSEWKSETASKPRKRVQPKFQPLCTVSGMAKAREEVRAKASRETQLSPPKGTSTLAPQVRKEGPPFTSVGQVSPKSSAASPKSPESSKSHFSTSESRRSTTTKSSPSIRKRTLSRVKSFFGLDGTMEDGLLEHLDAALDANDGAIEDTTRMPAEKAAEEKEVHLESIDGTLKTEGVTRSASQLRGNAKRFNTPPEFKKEQMSRPVYHEQMPVNHMSTGGDFILFDPEHGRNAYGPDNAFQFPPPTLDEAGFEKYISLLSSPIYPPKPPLEVYPSAAFAMSTPDSMPCVISPQAARHSETPLLGQTLPLPQMGVETNLPWSPSSFTSPQSNFGRRLPERSLNELDQYVPIVDSPVGTLSGQSTSDRYNNWKEASPPRMNEYAPWKRSQGRRRTKLHDPKVAAKVRAGLNNKNAAMRVLHAKVGQAGPGPFVSSDEYIPDQKRQQRPRLLEWWCKFQEENDEQGWWANPTSDPKVKNNIEGICTNGPTPKRQILLLHRVQSSSAFPSAHVFPGGNLSAQHDGHIPEPDAPARHQDGEAYRLGAIRETFEESGILLARNNGFGRLIEVRDDEREEGRKAIHQGSLDFRTWLARKGGRADTDGLIPFTRWITPPNIPKRFTTQMYLYFLPVASTTSHTDSPSMGSLSSNMSAEAMIPSPTHDGGIEHTAARFLPPSTWLRMANSGEIILFPPQYFLLHLIAPFLSPDNAPTPMEPGELSRQRGALLEFVRNGGGDTPWAEKVISPEVVLKTKSGGYGDGRTMLGLAKPGPELSGTGRAGDAERVVYVDFRKEGTRRVEVRMKKDAFEDEREMALHLVARPTTIQTAQFSLEHRRFPFAQPLNMQNEKGDVVDLYVPRKCSATNRIIKAKDHASVQISVGKVDENGRYTGENQTYALCGFVRAMGESDDSINRLAQRDGYLKGVWSANR
ncbi:MAG: hypothetical protein Q9165_003284 [Trypethelium subeluteriae]